MKIHIIERITVNAFVMKINHVMSGRLTETFRGTTCVNEDLD